MAEAPKRRLPVLGSEAPKRKLPVLRGDGAGHGGGEGAGGGHGGGEGGGDGEERPPWHWAVFGMVATFAAWLPLAGGTNALLRSVLLDVAGGAPSAGVQAAMVGLNALAFALAAAAGGFLVGRWGGKAGRREAAAGGALAGGFAWALALVQGAPAGPLGWALLLVVMASLGGWAAGLGGRIGLGRRPRGGVSYRDPR